MEKKSVYLEEKIIYFEAPGRRNTEETLRLVAERAKARGINKIVLASTRGDTARLAAERFAGSGIKMVVVPHQYGFGEDTTVPPGTSFRAGAERALRPLRHYAVPH